MATIKRRKLTRAQERVYKFILSFTKKHNMPPTLREISEHCGFASHNAAKGHMVLIARKGYLKLVPHEDRGIRVL